MMMRPPGCMCLSAACVATSVPRTLMSITRSISSSVVSSKVFGMAVPALFTSTSSRPKVATVFSTAPLTASTSAASAWIATAFPPLSSIALTTAKAALASFAYVMATLAPSASRRFAIAAPMPLEPTVMKSRTPCSSALSLQFRAERLVEAVGEVGGRDAERELHEGFRSQLLLELLHEPRIDLDLLCHLLRIADDQSLEIGEERVVRVVGQRGEFFRRHSVPLPEGRVVRHSIVATIDLRGLHVGELAQLEVERALAQRPVPRDDRHHGAGVVRHQPEGVQHAAPRFLHLVVHRLDVGRDLLAVEIRKSGGHVHLLLIAVSPRSCRRRR